MINEMPVDGFYDPEVLQYDCTPTEGVLTESQQEQNYLELKELRSLYPDAAGVITFSDIVEAAPIQARKQLLDRIKQREQQQAEAQKAAQEDQQRMNKLVEAETASKVARAQEDMQDTVESRQNTKLLNAKTQVELLNLQNEQVMDMTERLAKVNLMNAQAKAAMQNQQGNSQPRRKGRK